MAIGYLDSSKLTNIANAIRGKTGSASTMTVDQMPTNIDSIKVQVNEKDVNFVDYDGSLISSYTRAEFMNLYENHGTVPTPDHSHDEVPLTFQDWTWPLSIAYNHIKNYPEFPLFIGAYYVTTDGKTHAFYNVPEGSTLDIQVLLEAQSRNEINWGDGTTEIRYGNYSPIVHIYDNPGRYHVVFESTNTHYINWGDQSNEDIPRVSKLESVFYGNSNFTRAGHFYDCANLKYVTFPGSIDLPSTAYIDDVHVFSGCRALKAVASPYEKIGSQMFYETTNLKYVCLHHLCLTIGGNAFYRSGIEEVNLHQVTNYMGGSNFFSECRYLKHLFWRVDLEAGLGTMLMSLKVLRLDATLSSAQPIGANGLPVLTKLILTNGVTEIAAWSFYGATSLASVTLPTSTTKIGSYAFNSGGKGSAPSSIICLATTPPTLDGSKNFSATNIYVPAASVDAYKAAWTNYASIIEAIPE